MSTCAEQICGDGKRQGTEECDDFNTIGGDGCSETCTVEEGYECDGGNWEDKDECKPHCGDGIQMVGEACDDGNTEIGDGCSDKCLVEPGYECSEGECSTICGDGRRAGAEQCDDGNSDNGDGCSAACQVENNYSCSPVDDGADTCVLKVNCQTSEWGEFTACSKPCAGGIQKRTRVIVTSPANGGTLCPVLDDERRCNTQGCTPVDCVVSGWGAFGECSKKCGGGTQARTRAITTEPEHDGGPCPALTEERPCNTGTCAALACEVNQWSEWSACDKACGGGSAKRTRSIKSEAQNGGADCPLLSETRACNTAGCPQPVDCKVSEWSEFSECDKQCGGGLQTRNRNIEVEAAHGGAACPITIESRNCNTQGCPQ